MASLHDYLLDQHDLDWPKMLRGWSWLLPREFIVWLVNRFGDLFIVLDNGSVYRLDIGGGTLEQLSQSRDDFATKIDQDNNANDWLMIPLIDRLVARGVTLKKGQCYSYKQPPILGGNYTVENTCVVPLASHYGMYGAIHRKLEDVPDGTKVRIRLDNAGS